MSGYFQLLGLGIFLILAGFFLLLAALGSAFGGYRWLGVSDGWTFLLLGLIAFALGALAIRIQLRLTPE